MTYNIPPPDNLKNMFRNLLIGIDRKLRREYVLACLFMLVSLEMSISLAYSCIDFV